MTRDAGADPTWTIGFNIGAYDPHRILVIDPILTFATYLGGAGDDAGLDVALGPDGSVYVAGSTASPLLPVSGGGGSLSGAMDAFVTRLDPVRRIVLSSTYYGGSGDEEARAIQVDGSGRVFLAGCTTSRDMPTARPFQGANAGGRDGFVAVLTGGGGALDYATYTGLTPETPYYYQVRAVRGRPSEPSNVARATTLPSSQLDVSPKQLKFRPTKVGSSREMDVRLTNVGLHRLEYSAETTSLGFSM